MYVLFNVQFECKLNPEDEKAIEDGSITIEDIDWTYYMQDADATPVSIEED